MAGRRHNRTGRSTTERYVLIPHYILRSQAWKALTPLAVKVLLAVWRRHNGSNNGEISFAVREGAEDGLSKDQVKRGLEELAAFGFLRRTRESDFKLKTKLARTWELTTEPAAGKAASKDFMRWTPPAVGDESKSKTRSRRRDTQSRFRDREDLGAIMLPASVAQVRPSNAPMPDARSRQCDTYIIPLGSPQPGQRADDDDANSPPGEILPPRDTDRRHGKRPAVPDPRQTDIAGVLGDIPQNDRAQMIRVAIRKHLRGRKGERERVADAIGVLPSSLSNWIADGDGLNSNAVNKLAEIVGLAS